MSTGGTFVTYEVATGRHVAPPGETLATKGEWQPCAPFVIVRTWARDRVSGRCSEIKRNGAPVGGWHAMTTIDEREAKAHRFGSALEACAAHFERHRANLADAKRYFAEAEALLAKTTADPTRWNT